MSTKTIEDLLTVLSMSYENQPVFSPTPIRRDPTKSCTKRFAALDHARERASVLVLSIFIAQEPQMADFVKVANTNEIEPGQARLVDVKGKEIALFNVDGQFFALDNTCTHRGGPLAEGEVWGHEVTCPWHGATFDVRTGEVVGPPAERAVVRYGVRVTGTDIEVEW
ncbi:MAG: non-heme iron oxygenase ferredoxin subunit [Rhodoplanes sp.]